ncbi:hypothetical protein PAAG_11375 [Paracoccidioides lutzii Pb01]|uniref:Uncharacterized protein n=1 Tax=Paracoccidioides lutzii (strain ATCC MYA-826 / Pb01) TaxID=502779 RepID=A0A0A2V2U0_PARBA|nr:hypothetical protein PAAG_11375 [Paracoccidioides lutzii Pb01]KGQ01803.1 hypothetical protein PAAG_11375 [Paracoccidioides lutzii Pb01]
MPLFEYELNTQKERVLESSRKEINHLGSIIFMSPVQNGDIRATGDFSTFDYLLCTISRLGLGKPCRQELLNSRKGSVDWDLGITGPMHMSRCEQWQDKGPISSSFWE